MTSPTPSGHPVFDHTAVHCPYCGEGLNMATPAGSDRTPPRAGDMSVCFACAEVLIFDSRLRPCKPLPGELDFFAMSDPRGAAELERVQAAVKAMIKQSPILHAQSAYHDPTYPARPCDRCGKTYTGPAVYCSLECALADA